MAASPSCLMPGTLRYRVCYVATVVTGLAYLGLRCWSVWGRWLELAFSFIFELPLIIWIISESALYLHHLLQRIEQMEITS